jgi:hypothetical protein
VRPPPKHVESIHEGVVRIRDDAGGTHLLRYLGDQQLLQIVRELVAEGVAFVDQPAGWPPAAVVARFHDSGALLEPFKAIAWRGPGDWFVRDVPPNAR